MKKKITAALLLTAVMSLSACGGAANTDSGSSADKDVTTAAATEKETEAKETDNVPDEYIKDNSNNDFIYAVYGRHIEITGYIGKGGDVTIPKKIENLPVTVICEKSFNGNQDITSVVIPEGVTSIPNALFSDCGNLESASLPGTLTYIGESIFWHNSKLSNVTLSEGIMEIGEYMFYGCKELKSITIPSTVTKIGANSFYKSGIESIVIPDSVTEYGDTCFYYCKNLKSVTLSKNAKVLPNYMFEECEVLEKIVIPDCVEEIGDACFRGCKSLKEIELPENIEKISTNAFDGTP